MVEYLTTVREKDPTLQAENIKCK